MKEACPSAVAEVLPVVVDRESSDTMKALLSDSRIGIGHGSTDKAERYAQCVADDDAVLLTIPTSSASNTRLCPMSL